MNKSMSYIEHILCTRHFVRVGDTKIKHITKIYVLDNNKQQVLTTTGIEQKK